MKKYTKFEIAAMKRTAANVFQHIGKRDRLAAKVAELQAELDSINAVIDATDAPTKAMTGGFTTEDLFNRVVTDTGKKDKNGNPIKTTAFVLKYPETVVPTTEDTIPATVDVTTVDTEAKADEVETEDAFAGAFSEEDKNNIPFMEE